MGGGVNLLLFDNCSIFRLTKTGAHPAICRHRSVPAREPTTFVEIYLFLILHKNPNQSIFKSKYRSLFFKTDYNSFVCKHRFTPRVRRNMSTYTNYLQNQHLDYKPRYRPPSLIDLFHTSGANFLYICCQPITILRFI